MSSITRPKVLITGAAGGMGRACARLFGATKDLVLTDASAASLTEFVTEIEAEGLTVFSSHAGDLGSNELISALTKDVAGALPLTLIHTAGLSPALAPARPIMAINLVATVKLLNAVEPILRPGSVAILIASMAGHMIPSIPDALAILADPLATDFMDRIMHLVDTMSANAPAGAAGTSYSLSKQAVISLVEQRALSWGQRGARIVSISPGLILTPMGRKELTDTVGAMQLNEMAPAGRPGVAADIALAARFLASDEASFITGCDLRVDGGGTAVARMHTVGS
jgi:NAD(P)-dependent dehydrogenase (short-subunit alcohol dehydrogenase family)